jgi:hypothetical protein
VKLSQTLWNISAWKFFNNSEDIIPCISGILIVSYTKLQNFIRIGWEIRLRLFFFLWKCKCPRRPWPQRNCSITKTSNGCIKKTRRDRQEKLHIVSCLHERMKHGKFHQNMRRWKVNLNVSGWIGMEWLYYQSIFLPGWAWKRCLLIWEVYVWWCQSDC